ncbi:nucleotidyltransferase family protein [Paenibacillus macquariensis]|uniref:Nucleotidyl transferase AbiEii/AbiGii toxin family protein n=2 Tax=Paenibacillus macquariensis TaxID=948756 RepID=A0ABY1JJR0_9BACL|nr:hypothetical protein [Paenibacillus macquariensis]MEC0089778.1 hypothetical protein [Paenibacillus macquariensis]OAB30749.1 hypothetical protein PMSM_21660 [Paenibacillus macquariensis subsp. macquariensis]SIQ30987.1 hypothetical protein SAMN05421578_101154 [Paenibacillus macquariensis]
MHHLITEMQCALQMAARCLNSTNRVWLVGGSCSLLLQGVDVLSPPRDIDLYADLNSVHMLHTAMEEWSTDKQVLNKSGLYSSVLSHYDLNDTQIELVGDFTITAKGSQYRVEVEARLHPHAPEIELEGVPMSLMPLSHELLFNLLRERKDRYEAIATVIRQQPEHHVPLLVQLLDNNRLEANHIRQIAALLDLPSILQYDAYDRN